ncbi:competence/damage-inducible protein A [Clostridium tyrobutyricum]|jgi:nicotinamide-nucleotide amidase|uniref:Putative competence-damage inducible protein n=1 Tax=Clostridium tyrobutyricum DIVETGP TaxID=1408889 RepID=W6N453_CLOTY|nr:competence/damage-inducible protein A [Clostridium tyrobutyricum]AND83484.1 competence-damage inducible protein [Clostridium tyrobutyricum]ANP68281.1 competence/damage-inducible protein A [Clostridium tyrobutyricum]MBR9647811.1 competence/damage-inducible protein A [Clostridium tyrobutyricum]MBV4415743.1 competence/damage-inducible protein A [Clostridium tyrobutyricum]MBV4421580.1 competence/damage-inducible protein A [Clostridium tyrobutyricum]
MKAEILCVGTEILLGDIVNTNAQFISRELASIGIDVYHQSVVGDNPKRLLEELTSSFKRVDIVVTSGGLGPTPDDLTKEIGAQFFKKKMILDQNTVDKLKNYFDKMGRSYLKGNNMKQAYFPEGCTIMENDHGTAPGCIINENGKILIVLPGPPRELKPMFLNSAGPFLKKYSSETIKSKILRLYGIGEGEMAQRIKELIDKSSNPTIAPYAKENDVTLRITARANTEKDALKLIKPLEDKVKNIFGDNIYGYGETSMEEVVAKILVERNLTISTAESCTGGLIAAKFINYPGISSVFLDGAVTYSNEAKMHRLNVKKETLDKFGAVSEETAREMAEGIAKTSGTDIGLSTTGIAGPDGGSEEKPVGLVYVGLYIKGDVFVKKLQLSGERNKVRNRAAVSAIDYLRRKLI